MRSTTKLRLTTQQACVAALVIAGLMTARTVSAQTPAPAKPAAQTPAPAPSSAQSPAVNRGYVGGFGVYGSSTRSAGLGGVEAGVRVLHNLDVGIEVGWFQDAVAQSQIDAAASITKFLQDTNPGKAATGDVKVPATWGTLNARYVFERASLIRPYGIFGVGGARLENKSTFTLGGTDITGSLGSYGVLLGQDLTGHSTHSAVTVGGGIVVPAGMFYLDAGYRFTTILADEARNINRVHVGGGIRF